MKKCRIIILLPFILFQMTTYIIAQQPIESGRLSLDMIDLPTAAALSQGEYGIGLRVYPHGGVLSDFSIGIIDRFYGRIYYGGENLIGTGDVNWNPQIGVDFRARILDETLMMPAIAIGVNTQGYGGFNEEIDRYRIKSRGIYMVASRNYSTPAGDIALHGGVNFSLEDGDQDKDLNFFVGFEKLIPNVCEILVEYDSAVNDNETGSFGDGKGYLNSGIRFLISNDFFLKIYFKDMLENTKNTHGFGREISLEYRHTFKK